MGVQKHPSYFTHTWTGIRGCQHATLPDGTEHPGCTNCFAEALAKRNPKSLGVWGANGTRVRAADSYWRLPLKWDREADGPQPPRVLYDLGDLFEDWQRPIHDHNGNVLYRASANSGPPKRGEYCTSSVLGPCWKATMADCRRDVFELIDSTPNLIWLLTTKRPWNVLDMWCTYTSDVSPDCMMVDPDCTDQPFRANVWLGVSVSDQNSADQLIPELLKLRDLSPVLWVSVEPLLGPIELAKSFPCGYYCDESVGHVDHAFTAPNFSNGGLSFCVVGAESGPNRRPCQVEWIASIVDQCKAAGVHVWVKQDGANRPGQQGRIPDELWEIKEMPDATHD